MGRVHRCAPQTVNRAAQACVSPRRWLLRFQPWQLPPPDQCQMRWRVRHPTTAPRWQECRSRTPNPARAARVAVHLQVRQGRAVWWDVCQCRTPGRGRCAPPLRRLQAAEFPRAEPPRCGGRCAGVCNARATVAPNRQQPPVRIQLRARPARCCAQSSAAATTRALPASAFHPTHCHSADMRVRECARRWRVVRRAGSPGRPAGPRIPAPRPDVQCGRVLRPRLPPSRHLL